MSIALDESSPSNRTKKVDERKNRSVPQPRTPVKSVSWRRKPSFPDPFVAQRRAILTQESVQSKEVKDRFRSSVSDSQSL